MALNWNQLFTATSPPNHQPADRQTLKSARIASSTGNSSLRSSLVSLNSSLSDVDAEARYQQRLNRDVIISGFASAPNINAVVADLGAKQSTIDRIGGFQDKSGNYFITVTFKERSEKEKFLIITSKLTIRERLTRFNVCVERQLRLLRRDGLIYSFSRPETFFQVKFYQTSRPIVVSSIGALNGIVEKANEIEKEMVARMREQEEQSYRQKSTKPLCSLGDYFEKALVLKRKSTEACGKK